LYAQHGTKVVVHGRDDATVVRPKIREQYTPGPARGGRAMQVGGDVTSFSDIEAAHIQIEGGFGPVDILV